METRSNVYYKQFNTPWQDLFSNPPNEGLERLIVEDLKKSGLSPDIVSKANLFIFTGDSDDLKKYLGFSSFNGHPLTRGFSLLGFPYFDSLGKVLFVRFRIYPPMDDTKYLQPSGVPAIPYILPEIWGLSQKPNRPLWITEGEKKTLKLIQHGRNAIGLSGVWNFRAGEKTARDEKDRWLWKELKDFDWTGRVVFIAYDSDLLVNPHVRQALFELCLKLYCLGANVKIPTWDKRLKGIDDYLAAKDNPEEALTQLEEKAKDWHELVQPSDLEIITKGLTTVIELLSPARRQQLMNLLSQRLLVKPRTLIAEVLNQMSSGQENELISEEEREKALELLKSPTLIKDLLSDLHEIYVGRDEHLILLKLATITRKFSRGLSVVLTGTASVGKSSLVETVLRTVWDYDKIDFTRMSENFLLYSEKEVAHKVITFYEADGTRSGAYILRTALSEGKLSLGTVVKEKDKLVAKEINKSADGVVLITTTTKDIDYELGTRALKIEISHDPELARNVFRHIAESMNKDQKLIEEKLNLWRVADSLLEPVEVVIPFARKLAELFPTSQERYLRDFQKVLTLIKASACLHQYQRPRDEKGRVIATREDYELVYSLRNLLTDSISPIPAHIRRFLEEVRNNTRTSSDGLREDPTREQIRQRLGVSEATIKRYVKFCVDNEYLKVYGKGPQQRLEVIDIPESTSPLPEPSMLFDEPDELNPEITKEELIKQIEEQLLATGVEVQIREEITPEDLLEEDYVLGRLAYIVPQKEGVKISLMREEEIFREPSRIGEWIESVRAKKKREEEEVFRVLTNSRFRHQAFLTIRRVGL